MLGKLAHTLAEAGARVAVAGRASAAAPSLPGVRQYALLAGGRLSWARLAAQGRYWQLLRQLRPTLVVVCAPELLPLTLLWQRLGRGRQFVYDVQENYVLNVQSQRVYGGLVRRVLAAGLGWVQARAARQAAAVLLAERSYADELPWLRHLAPGRVLVLENTYQPPPGEVLPTQPPAPPVPTEPLQLLFSGTLSVLNGVREAVALARALRQRWPGGARLLLIGYCQQPTLLAELEALAATEADWLTLVGGREPVPYQQVVAAMTGRHLGLLPYQPHPSTWRCRPTKLFEYLAHALPVAVPPNPLWTSLVQHYGAGLAVDFAAPDAAAQAVAAALEAGGFYAGGVPGEGVQWAGEGKKLRHLLQTILPGATFAAPIGK